MTTKEQDWTLWRLFVLRGYYEGVVEPLYWIYLQYQHSMNLENINTCLYYLEFDTSITIGFW